MTQDRSTAFTPTHFTRIETRLGKLLLVGDEAGSRMALRGVYFDGEPHAAGAVPEGASENAGVFAEVRQQLEAYLCGERRTFELLLAPAGTEFQEAVWRTLSTIPYGATTTYAEIARRLGKPSAMRAVGAANARNPISIVVPCHRVIGADGTLTGYAGGALRKRQLLEIEQAAKFGVSC